MNYLRLYSLTSFLILVTTAFQPRQNLSTPPANGFTMNLCISGHNGDVKSGDIYLNNVLAGHIIVLERKSEKVKAKYFAYKQNGTSVHDRYDSWRIGKKPILISSGAYANGFQSSDIPVGLTVDNGEKVNDALDLKMDGLVIVEAVGGVRISNIEDADLTIQKTNSDNTTTKKTISLKKPTDKIEFLRWCESEKATVFQTHLLIYKNKLKFTSSESKQAIRKLLVLAEDKNGTVYHMVIYCKQKELSLYEMANNSLKMLNDAGYSVVAAANLDTGAFDILSTSTELYDCSYSPIVGTSNKDRKSMSNILAYYYE